MKLRITDDQALDSLIAYSINHRAAIAGWAAREFETARAGDKASFAVEVFEKFVGAVEDLEMLYFALLARVADQSKSFLSQYERVSVREHPTGRGDTSAAEVLRQVQAMDAEAFRVALGLPTADEFHKIIKQGQGTLTEAATEYIMYLSNLKTTIETAVMNRSKPEIMGVYNKIKHGFVVMNHAKDGLFMVGDVVSENVSESTIEGKPFAPTTDSLMAIVTSMQVLARTCRELLMLHFRRKG